jgi:DNA-directed RNA polymerase subunit N
MTFSGFENVVDCSLEEGVKFFLRELNDFRWGCLLPVKPRLILISIGNKKNFTRQIKLRFFFVKCAVVPSSRIMFPVRCFTCNAVIEHKYNHYATEIGKNRTRFDVLKELNVERICCRRMFLSHVSTIDDILHYGNDDEVLDEANTRFMCRPTPSEKVSCD